MLAIQEIGKATVSIFTEPDHLDPTAILHPIEFEQWQPMPPHRAWSFLRGRYALKRLLTTEETLRHWLVSHTPVGKPIVSDSPDVSCSISHTDAYAVAATSVQGAIGVDVEKISPRHPALLRSISTEEEVRDLAGHFSRDELPTVVWTIKEAVAKADTAIFPFQQYRIVLRDRIRVQRSNNHWDVTLTDVPSHICAVAIALFV